VRRAVPTLTFAVPLLVVMTMAMLQKLYTTRVVRRHEAEADELAVAVTGADALLAALTKLGASRGAGMPIHNRGPHTAHGKAGHLGFAPSSADGPAIGWG
jgi:Zn-dependent protease with chaperone function